MTSALNAHALVAHNLCKTYGPVPIVHNFTHHFLSGMCTGISGPSGCGKSTLLALLAGCENPDSGSAFLVDETGIQTSIKYGLQNYSISYVPQHTVLIPELSVYENISCKLLLAGATDKEEIHTLIIEWAYRCNIESLLTAYPATLSGGQRQRVAFVTGCIVPSHFLLIDEPTAHLDREHALQIITLCKKLVKQGTGIILATHDQDILTICDHIIICDTLISHT